MRRPNQRSDRGTIVNRIWHAGRCVKRLTADHDVGGFVVVADYDEQPSVVEFLPIIGLVLFEEDDGSVIASAAGLYSVGEDGGVEFWDMGEVLPDEVLGVTDRIDVEIRDHYANQAALRLAQLRTRSREAEHVAVESFGGGRDTEPVS